MFLLLLRRLLELVLFSIVPGCIATIVIFQDSLQRSTWFYPVLLIVSIACAFIFFAGNLLMMRRMVRDIESKEKYHFGFLHTRFIICLAFYNNLPDGCKGSARI